MASALVRALAACTLMNLMQYAGPWADGDTEGAEVVDLFVGLAVIG